MLVLTIFSHGMGSLDTEEVIIVLKQNAPLYKSLDEAFEFSKGAVGSRIGNVGDAKLGGTRVGPYEFYARPKGTNGDWIFKIIIETEIKYYKKDGQVATLFDGEVVQEKLTSVRIVPMNNKQAQQAAP